MLQVQREAIQAVEQDGIVFIDEIDKIVVNQDLRYGELPFADSHTHTCALLAVLRQHRESSSGNHSRQDMPHEVGHQVLFSMPSSQEVVDEPD